MSVELNFNELRELVAALSQTDIAELTLKSSDFELVLRKPSAVAAASAASMVVAPDSQLAADARPPSPASSILATPAAPATVPEPQSKPTPPPSAESNLQEISSPMVGTFYRAPAPDEPPFVDVGERIKLGQTVCIIEAMKLMNELEAEVAGEIVEILVENGDSVEFGQVLMRVKSA